MPRRLRSRIAFPPRSAIAAELGQERRRDRVAGFPPQVDDANGWQLPSEPAAELEPLEALPALGPGRGAPVEDDRSVEGSALRGDRPGVVARVRLLLVRGVVLLVDADHAEVGHRREQRRARTDDDGRRPGRDSLSLVAPLRVRERRVENRDAVAEARPQASDGLRSEGDLGDEHDRAAAARERVCAGLEVDLGLAAPRGAVEQEERMLSCVDCLADACERRLLRFAQLGRGRLAGERVAIGGRGPLCPARALLRGDERERPTGSRAVVVRHPQREVDERRRHLVEHTVDRPWLDARGRVRPNADDHAATACARQRDGDDRALADAVLHRVCERPGESPRRDERVDGGERHPSSVVVASAAAGTGPGCYPACSAASSTKSVAKPSRSPARTIQATNVA